MSLIVCIYHAVMELLPISAPYDEISERMRQFSAHRLMEMIESLRPSVDDALRDSPSDLEPNRLNSYAGLIKLYGQLIKQLGDLYQVNQRPPAEDTEDTMPLTQVTALLEAAEARMEEELETAVAAALQQGREEAQQQEQLSLEAARGRLLRQLAAVKQISG